MNASATCCYNKLVNCINWQFYARNNKKTTEKVNGNKNKNKQVKLPCLSFIFCSIYMSVGYSVLLVLIDHQLTTFEFFLTCPRDIYHPFYFQTANYRLNICNWWYLAHTQLKTQFFKFLTAINQHMIEQKKLCFGFHFIQEVIAILFKLIILST